jgi:hypothetical protein
MSTEVEYPPEQNAATLVSGILGDLQHLVGQQFHLTRREIEEDLRRRAAAAAVFGIGMGVFFLDAIVLCLTLAHLLHSVASPPGTDPAWLPLWACHAMVAAGLAVIGGILVGVGRAKFKIIEPFPNPLTEIWQEFAPWTTHPKESDTRLKKPRCNS